MTHSAKSDVPQETGMDVDRGGLHHKSSSDHKSAFCVGYLDVSFRIGQTTLMLPTFSAGHERVALTVISNSCSLSRLMHLTDPISCENFVEPTFLMGFQALMSEPMTTAQDINRTVRFETLGIMSSSSWKPTCSALTLCNAKIHLANA